MYVTLLPAMALRFKLSVPVNTVFVGHSVHDV